MFLRTSQDLQNKKGMRPYLTEHLVAEGIPMGRPPPLPRGFEYKFSKLNSLQSNALSAPLIYPDKTRSQTLRP